MYSPVDLWVHPFHANLEARQILWEVSGLSRCATFFFFPPLEILIEICICIGMFACRCVNKVIKSFAYFPVKTKWTWRLSALQLHGSGRAYSKSFILSVMPSMFSVAIFCATVKLWIWISSVQSAMETLSQGTEEEGVPRAKPQEHWNHHPSPPVLVMPLCNVGKALAVLCPCLVSLQPWPCEGITLRIQDRLAANACLTYHCLMLSEGQGEEVSLLTLRNCVDLVGINYVR